MLLIPSGWWCSWRSEFTFFGASKASSALPFYNTFEGSFPHCFVLYLFSYLLSLWFNSLTGGGSFIGKKIRGAFSFGQGWRWDPEQLGCWPKRLASLFLHPGRGWSNYSGTWAGNLKRPLPCRKQYNRKERRCADFYDTQNQLPLWGRKQYTPPFI